MPTSGDTAGRDRRRTLDRRALSSHLNSRKPSLCFLAVGGVYAYESRAAGERHPNGNWEGLGEAMIARILLPTGVLLFLVAEGIGIPLAVQNDLRMRSIRQSARRSLQVSLSATPQAVCLGLRTSF